MLWAVPKDPAQSTSATLEEKAEKNHLVSSFEATLRSPELFNDKCGSLFYLASVAWNTLMKQIQVTSQGPSTL